MKNILKYNEVKAQILGHSQKGQDSLIQYTFEKIGTTNKYYVEFGAIDGLSMCNTWYLRNKCNWNGLLLEGNTELSDNPSINLHIRRISKDNICDLFKEFDVPKEFDFLSIDLDGIDYWVMKSILEGNYSPRFIMVEANVRFEPHESFALKYTTEWNWDHVKWCGASPFAFKKLFNSFGYIPVWMHEDDMMVIRKDVLEKNGYSEPDWSYVYPKSNSQLYKDQRVGNYFVSQLNLDEWTQI